jgi:hypothetical protein
LIRRRGALRAALASGLLSACGSPPAEDASGTTGDEPPAWASWTTDPAARYRGQIFEGDVSFASDPCVIRDGDVLRMVYTCPSAADRGGFCEATSPDGVSWSRVASITPGIEGLVLDSVPGAWNENIETCSLIAHDDGIDLYYSGYPNLDGNGDRDPAALGRAHSDDGVSFAFVGSDPLMTPTPHGLDGSDIFSADVFEDGGDLDAVYVGWCSPGYHHETSCDDGGGIVLAGATQDAAGDWVKRDEPVLVGTDGNPAMAYGVAEPDVVLGADGAYYLFFTGGLGDTEPRVTLQARGDSPFGPWDIDPDPLWLPEPGTFEACGAFAPAVVLEEGAARMWYIAIDDCAGECTSCDFATCACEPTWSIGYAEAPWPP